jgi:MATE family multidrug resistance protein
MSVFLAQSVFFYRCVKSRILYRLLVHRSGMGFLGAAVAASVSPWINVVVLACYCHGSQRSDLTTRAACSLPSLCDLKPFLALALPSSAMSWYV